MILAKVPKDYVTEMGCYVGTYIFYFLAPYGNIHSFFIAFFRYICIVHPTQLSKRDISPEVRHLGKKWLLYTPPRTARISGLKS